MLLGAATLALASAAAEPSLTLPTLPTLPRPPAVVAAGAGQAPIAPRLSEGELAQYWAGARAAMAGCEDVVASARRRLQAHGPLPEAALRTVQTRCAAAAADVGSLEPPSRAGPRVAGMLRDARDACLRSMIEHQLAIEAIDGFLRTGAPADYPETRIRADAIDRGALNCRASFDAAARSAGHPLPNLDLVS